MAPPNPKRPPRPRNPPDDSETPDDGELPFDERDATPLRADDPKPQRVTTYPALKSARGRSRARDTALAGGFATASVAATLSSEVFLYAERGPGSGQLLPIALGTLVLGRSSSADLRLPHASISRRHARLQRRGERFFIEDLGSQNGTYLEEERLSAEHEVLLGQRIHIGPAVLRLRRPGMADVVAEDMDAGVDAWSSPVISRRRMWRIALVAGAAGFLLAALLALCVARLQPSASWRAAEPPAAQTR
jgi:pSer/pThr/pTyr-binding forkhead associated (FHA) protein